MASGKTDKTTVSADATDQGMDPTSGAQTAPAVQPSVAVSTFRDTVYTSRVLILPGGRQLRVTAGRVTAPVMDTAALDYLNQHPDLEPVPE
ncbi:hypothetical protein [Pseudomonas caspiana]|uniref:hypothetical protein n=1 Tax=Pseudomonas caspiana TaxID=1451454 RepID=UPI0032EAE4EF